MMPGAVSVSTNQLLTPLPSVDVGAHLNSRRGLYTLVQA